MKACIWQGVGDVVFGEWETPSPRPGEVLVRVAYCGFCGSDAHIIEGRLPIGRPPQVLGHEVSGTIAALGEDVRGFEIGERVACNLYGYCGACAWCRSGQPNHCRQKFFSAKGFAEYAIYRPQQLFKLPDDVSLQLGAFLEPVATMLHTIDVGEVRPGDRVLVIGGGPLGLIGAQLARAAGASTLVVSEPRAHNRSLALAHGADLAVDPLTDDLVEIARGMGPRRGFDVIYEVAGVTAAAAQAPELASTRGRVVIVAVFDQQITIPVRPYLLYDKEIAIRGSLAADSTFERAVGFLSRLQLEPLISAVEPLERISEVYASHKAGQYVKVILAPEDGAT